MRTIRVTGKGQLRVKPDQTRITLSLEGLYPEYGETLRRSNQDTEKIRDLLTELGFARTDLKTLKEQEYDTLMRNMSVMVLAPDILSDIHEKMKTIKEEIKVLENTTSPEEYSTDVILDWLKSIRTAPDSRAVHLLVQRIEVTSDNEKTDFNAVSTLESVSEKLVRVVITDSAPNDYIP